MRRRFRALDSRRRFSAGAGLGSSPQAASCGDSGSVFLCGSGNALFPQIRESQLLRSAKIPYTALFPFLVPPPGIVGISSHAQTRESARRKRENSPLRPGQRLIGPLLRRIPSGPCPRLFSSVPLCNTTRSQKGSRRNDLFASIQWKSGRICSVSVQTPNRRRACRRPLNKFHNGATSERKSPPNIPAIGCLSDLTGLYAHVR